METYRWYVMRDLKRANAKLPAYKMLGEMGIETFVPMRWEVSAAKGKRQRRQVPVVRDLLFVRAQREVLDPIVDRTDTLQYRWLRNTYREPMTVPDAEMQRFIGAVGATESPKFYLPDEITPQMYGRKIRIVGGPLDGYEGSLVTTRGSRIKRLLVKLENYLAVAVEVNPEYIQLL